MTGGGPNNASTLLLYYIYQVAFTFRDTAYAAALTVVLLVILSTLALIKFGSSRPQDPLSMNAGTASPSTGAAASTLAVLAVRPGLACRSLTRSGARCIRRPMRPRSACPRPDAGEFRACLEPGAVRRATYLNTIAAGARGAGRPVRAVARWRPIAFARFEVPRQRHRCSRWCCCS